MNIESLSDLLVSSAPEATVGNIINPRTVASNYIIDVPFTSLFPSSFLLKCSNYNDFWKLMEDGNISVKTQEDFDKIPISTLDKVIRENTSFSSWNEMFQNAVDLYKQNLLK